MNKSDYFIYVMTNYLEDALPSELFKEVRKYLKNSAIDCHKGVPQWKIVLTHLEEKGFITNMQCHILYGIRHAPGVIRDIKKKLLLQGGNFYIDTEPVKGCDRYGNKRD